MTAVSYLQRHELAHATSRQRFLLAAACLRMVPGLTETHADLKNRIADMFEKRADGQRQRGLMCSLHLLVVANLNMGIGTVNEDLANRHLFSLRSLTQRGVNWPELHRFCLATAVILAHSRLPEPSFAWAHSLFIKGFWDSILPRETTIPDEPGLRALASDIYRNRLEDGRLNPSLLGLLADALEEFGVGQEEVLLARGEMPLYRGYWVVERLIRTRTRKQ